MKNGRVYLIGAGPGNKGLLTLRGAEIIGFADALVYDRLAGSGIFGLASPDVELYYVGKEDNKHSSSQDEINALIVRLALDGKIVARIKGGDPFVFGRGGEEAEELIKHGIDFEVVPGVTSAIAAPAFAGIPVTHRGLSSSFHVITGHEHPQKTESSIDYKNLAALKGTLVFLMGISKL